MNNTYELFSNSVSCLCRDIRKLEQIEMEKYGLKGPHAQCILSLSLYPDGLTATQLCELCGKDKADVSRAVGKMEEIGLLQRVGSNPYRAKLKLTQQGIAAAEAVRETAGTIVDRVGGDLTEEKRTVFYEVLALVTANLEKLCKEI